jgi:hypothetical protein
MKTSMIRLGVLVAVAVALGTFAVASFVEPAVGAGPAVRQNAWGSSWHDVAYKAGEIAHFDVVTFGNEKILVSIRDSEGNCVAQTPEISDNIHLTWMPKRTQTYSVWIQSYRLVPYAYRYHGY